MQENGCASRLLWYKIWFTGNLLTWWQKPTLWANNLVWALNKRDPVENAETTKLEWASLYIISLYNVHTDDRIIKSSYCTRGDDEGKINMESLKTTNRSYCPITCFSTSRNTNTLWCSEISPCGALETTGLLVIESGLVQCKAKYPAISTMVLFLCVFLSTINYKCQHESMLISSLSMPSIFLDMIWGIHKLAEVSNVKIILKTKLSNFAIWLIVCYKS